MHFCEQLAKQELSRQENIKTKVGIEPKKLSWWEKMGRTKIGIKLGAVSQMKGGGRERRGYFGKSKTAGW